MTFHYENMSVQYEAISKSEKTDIFRCNNVTFFQIFARIIDCEYTLEPPQWGGSNEYPQSIETVLTSTHNLCFRAKIRKMNTPVNPSYTI